MQLSECSLSTLSGLVAAGKAKSAAIVDACLARIAAREGSIHAWVHHDPAQVRAVHAQDARAHDVRSPDEERDACEKIE